MNQTAIVRIAAAALVAVSDGVVADPFAGSGSTLVAARNLGRLDEELSLPTLFEDGAA